MKSSLISAAIAALLLLNACTPNEELPQPKRYLLSKVESMQDGILQSTLTYSYNSNQTASGIAMKSLSDSNSLSVIWQNNRISSYTMKYRDEPAPVLSELEYTGQLHTKTYSAFVPNPITLDSITYNADGKINVVYIKDLQGDGHWQTLFVDKYSWTGNNITTEQNFLLNHNGDTTFRNIKTYTYSNQPNLQAKLPHVPVLWLYSRSATGVSESLVSGVSTTINGIESNRTSGTYTYVFDENNYPTQRIFTGKDGKKTIANFTYITY